MGMHRLGRDFAGPRGLGGGKRVRDDERQRSVAAVRLHCPRCVYALSFTQRVAEHPMYPIESLPAWGLCLQRRGEGENKEKVYRMVETLFSGTWVDLVVARWAVCAPPNQ
jgi:hypothetical protein